MDCNLYQRIKDRTSFLPEAKVRNIIYQVLLVCSFICQRKNEWIKEKECKAAKRQS